MRLRKATRSDLPFILELFVNTVGTVCSHDYSENQIKIWTSVSDNKKEWENKIDQTYFIIAETENKIVGFGSLDPADNIDLLYIHHKYHRCGIGQAILNELEKESKKKNTCELFTNASITSYSFFKNQGFRELQEQRRILHGEEFINYKMSKVI